MAPKHLPSLALDDVEQCAAALRLLRKLLGDGQTAYAESVTELRNSIDIAWVAAMRLQSEMRETVSAAAVARRAPEAASGRRKRAAAFAV